MEAILSSISGMEGKKWFRRHQIAYHLLLSKGSEVNTFRHYETPSHSLKRTFCAIRYLLRVGNVHLQIKFFINHIRPLLRSSPINIPSHCYSLGQSHAAERSWSVQNVLRNYLELQKIDAVSRRPDQFARALPSL